MARNDISVNLTATDKTRAAFDSVKHNLDGLGRAASGIGELLSFAIPAVSIAGIAGLVKSTIDAQDELSKLSQKTGIAVESLAGLQHAADLSDVEVEQLAKGVRTFSVLVEQAANGQKSYQDKLTTLGLSYQKLKNLSPEKQFYELADAVKRLGKEDRAAVVAGALGDRLSSLVPLLSDGAEGLRQMVEEGKRLNPVTTESARRSEEFKDNLSRLKKEAGLAAIELSVNLLPSLADTAKSMEDLAAKGHGVLALLRGIAGIGKLPFDLLFGDGSGPRNAQQRIKELKQELSDMQRHLPDVEGGGALQKWLYGGSADELKRRIEVTKNQIAALEKFGDKVYARPASPSTPRDDTSARLACLASGGTWDGNKCRPAASGGGVNKGSLWADDMATALKAADAELKQYQEDAAFVAQGDLERANAINAIKQEWIDAGQAIEQEYLPANEKLAQRIDYLNELFNRGVISQSALDAATADAFDSIGNRIEKTKGLAEELGLTFSSAFEDAVIGGHKFSDVLKGLAQDIERIILRKNVTEPLANAIGSFDWGSLFASANGNVFSGVSGLSDYSGTLVNKPTIVPFASGGILMGEAGTEGVFPVVRGKDGKLGVKASGSDGGVQVNIIEAPGRGGQVSQRNDGGSRIIDVMVDQIKSAIAGDITRGGGQVSGAMEHAYGLSRVPGSY